MRRLLIGITALAVLVLPQAAFSKQSDEGSESSPMMAQPQQPTSNFHVRGNGTAVSCGAGCTQVSGTYTSNQFSGTFVGRITGNSGAGCSAVQGTISLQSGEDSAIQGISGTQCGAFFSGDYMVTDGTGAYQNNGSGWGDVAFTMKPGGAFTMSSDGTFYPQQPRQ
jgi:hypothetical protein